MPVYREGASAWSKIGTIYREGASTYSEIGEAYHQRLSGSYGLVYTNGPKPYLVTDMMTYPYQSTIQGVVHVAGENANYIAKPNGGSLAQDVPINPIGWALNQGQSGFNFNVGGALTPGELYWFNFLGGTVGGYKGVMSISFSGFTYPYTYQMGSNSGPSLWQQSWIGELNGTGFTISVGNYNITEAAALVQCDVVWIGNLVKAGIPNPDIKAYMDANCRGHAGGSYTVFM